MHPSRSRIKKTTNQDDSEHQDLLKRLARLNLNKRDRPVTRESTGGPSRSTSRPPQRGKFKNTLSAIENWKSLSVEQDVTSILLKINECEESAKGFLQKLSTFEEFVVVFDLLNVVVSSSYSYSSLSVVKVIFTKSLMEKLIKMFGDNVLVWFTRGINQVLCLIENIKRCCSVVQKFGKHFEEDNFLATFDALLLSIVACLDNLCQKTVQLGIEPPVNLNGLLTDIKEAIARKNDNVEEQPKANFSFFPEDLLVSCKSIVSNITVGSYMSPEHYIETQMNLLKEDFEICLRAGVALHLHDPRARNYDIWTYNDVTVELGEANKKGHLCKIVLNDTFLTKIEWDKSNRFLHGSMVIISSGNFEVYHLGLVRDRGNVESRRMMPGKKPYIFVEFLFSPPRYSSNNRYQLIEPKTFFEPYYQVMLSLASLHKTGLPLERYLVNVDTSPRLPDYINASTEYTIDQKVVRVSETAGWPDANAMSVNESQKSAVMNALTNELVLIQGPPGTGKTYLAFKLIKYLVDNKKFSSPILIVCYKNHSLDQILEGLLDRRVSVLRIGAQSKSEKLKDYNLSKVVSPAVSAIFREIKNNEEMAQDNASELREPWELVNQLKTKRGIVCLELFRASKIITGEIYGYFFGKRCDQGFVRWLLDSDSYQDDIPPHPTADEIKTADRMTSLSQNMYAISLDEIVNSIENRKVKYNKLVADSEKGSLNSKKRKALYHETIRIVDDLFRLSLLRFRLNNFREVIADKSTVQSLLSTPNLNDIPLEDRWKIYNFWETELKDIHEISLQKKMETHFTLKEAHAELKDMFKCRQIEIRGPQVVGLTTSGAAAHHRVLQKIAPAVVIVEEAAEVLESHIVASLSKSCEQLILIGDHQQLKPSTASHEMAEQYHMNVSLFERMMLNGIRCNVLNVQHRMRPEIAALISPSIYPDLVNHPSVTAYPNVAGVAKNVIFFHHERREEMASDSESRFNRFEADFALAFCSYLLKQQTYLKNPGRITILTTYKEQERYMMKGRNRLGLDLPEVLITAVDNYQGEENDVIILSLVRSNLEGNIGFLATKNRVCVALSRAKHGLYILGNLECLVKKKSSIWCEIYDVLLSQEAIVTEIPLKCAVHGNETRVKNVEEILDLKHGGCHEKCRALFECGHTCTRKCHGYDMDHKKKFMCQAPCEKKCPEGHSCTKVCSADCPPCKVSVSKRLPCEHTENVPCSESPTNNHCRQHVRVKFEKCDHELIILCRMSNECECTETCGKDLECGHKCTQICHTDDDPSHEDYECTQNCTKVNPSCPDQHECTLMCFEDCGPCLKKVPKILPCGHSVEMECSEDIDDVTCNEACTHSLEPCGHACPNPCSEPCGPCNIKIEFKIPCGHEGKKLCGSEDPKEYECTEKCTLVKDCGHECSGLCWEDCSEECTEKCNRVKKCGHMCSGICSEECGKDCAEKCTKIKECGHACRGKCSDDCSKVKCCFKVERKIPCGHTIHVECHKVKVSPDDLIGLCKSPCREILPSCGHQCQGTCGLCLQGRVHRGCAVVCNQPLRCSHKCEALCGTLYHSCSRKACDSACWSPSSERREDNKRERNTSYQKRAFNQLNGRLWNYLRENHAKQKEDEIDELGALLKFASQVSVGVTRYKMDRRDTLVTLMSHTFLVEFVNVARQVLDDASKKTERASISHYLDNLIETLGKRDIHHLTSTEISQVMIQVNFLKGCLAVGQDHWSEGKSLFEMWNDPNFPPKIVAESKELSKALFTMTNKNVVAIVHHRD